jgi:hypothetical protein
VQGGDLAAGNAPPAKQTAPASDDNSRRGSRGKKKSESPLTPCPCKPLLLYFSHRALLLLLCFKECLLDFTANADQPFFRMSGAVPKIVCLCLKFARSFFGCPNSMTPSVHSRPRYRIVHHSYALDRRRRATVTNLQQEQFFRLSPQHRRLANPANVIDRWCGLKPST